MRVLGRLLIAVAVLLPVMVVVAGVANGSEGPDDGTAVMKCMHWKDAMHVAPGLTHTPVDQTVDAHGRLYGCNKAGGGGTYKGQMSMTAATCSGLSMSGTGHFNWANGKSSTATLVFEQQPTEPRKFFVSGQVTSGLFNSLLVHSWVRFNFTFNGVGAPCSPSNPLKKIDFTNTQSLQLFNPRVTTTTTTFRPTTTSRPPRSTTIPRATTTIPPNNTTIPPSNTTVPITTTASTAAPPLTQGPVCCAPPPPPGGGPLAFTGGGGFGALVGLESVLIGGALACFGEGRRRRALRLATVHTGPKRWLQITMPPDFH